MKGIRRLARHFRLYGKKRGERRTGSQRWGNAGLLAFFGGLLLVGWIFLAVTFAALAFPEWKANRQFVEGVCTVLQQRIGVNDRGAQVTYRPEVRIEYRVDEETYRRWTYDITGAYSSDRRLAEATLEDFKTGQTYPCWYDPSDPDTVVLTRGYTGYVWLLLLLPTGLIAVGLVGLFYNGMRLGASPERRAAMARRAAELATPERRSLQAEFPGVPSDAALTDSPGDALTYRLPLTDSNSRSAGALVLGALLWNALVTVFATLSVRAFLAGRPDWPLTAISAVFLLVGLWLLFVAARRAAQATSVGATLVEISGHPLHPGEVYQVFLAQYGRSMLRTLRMTLVCEESATYQQGTNTRVESRLVLEQEIFAERNLLIQPGAPFEIERDLATPAAAMHSFRAGHNEIAWRLVVRGRPVGWPPFERSFPLVIYPVRAQPLA